jgi:hypothetical protein
MLSLFGRGTRLCDGLTRREALRVGGLGLVGLTWADWLRARAAGGAGGQPAAGGFGRARACILIFNYGGPSHLDTWDLKPGAPAEVRGEFRPITTAVPGLSITEHLPRLARLARHYAVVRSVTHRDNDHAIGAYLALTGHHHPRNAVLGIEPPATPQDMPALGSAVASSAGAARSIRSRSRIRPASRAPSRSAVTDDRARRSSAPVNGRANGTVYGS